MLGTWKSTLFLLCSTLYKRVCCWISKDIQFISICVIRQRLEGHINYMCCTHFRVDSNFKDISIAFYQSCIMTFINKQPEIRFTHLNHLCNFAQLHISVSVILLHKYVKCTDCIIICCMFLYKQGSFMEAFTSLLKSEQKYHAYRTKVKISRPSKTFILLLVGPLINGMDSIFQLHFQRPIFT